MPVYICVERKISYFAELWSLPQSANNKDNEKQISKIITKKSIFAYR